MKKKAVREAPAKVVETLLEQQVTPVVGLMKDG
jgi:hypothetical protein